jgi:hypothetical protein
VDRRAGVLVLDDTTLETPDAQPQGLVTSPWSGTPHRVVKGITRLPLLWTASTQRRPCDFRVYAKPAGGETQHAHVRPMWPVAQRRGLSPPFVLFDRG